MSNLSEQWILSNKLSAQEVAEINQLTPEQKEYYFSNQNLQFGTAGIRALMGMGTTRLNNYTCAQIFHAYAKYLKKYYTVGDIKILIGHDNRNNSFGFSMLAARVFNSYGIKVVLFKKNILIPTPIVSYTIRSIGAAGGINITASHNPKEYNGIKFYLSDGTQITTEDVEISQLMCNPNEIINTNFNFELTNVEYLSNNIISQYFYDAKNAQIDHISVHNDQKKYPIIVATNQGTMSKLFPKYIKKILGFKKVHPVKNQAKIDPNFTFTPYPNPEDPRSFEQAKILADRKNSDICIGVDPDGDRMAVCIKKNGTWVHLTGNQTGTLFTYYILKNKRYDFNKPYIVISHVTTNIVDMIANEFQADVYRVNTGFKWIGSAVSALEGENSLVCAFEESIGALVYPINRDKDAFTATTILLEIYLRYKELGMDFLDVLDTVYTEYGFNYAVTVSYEFSGMDWKNQASVLMKQILTQPANVKIGNDWMVEFVIQHHDADFTEWALNQNSWIRFRLSGTEPKLKAYFCIYGKNSNDAHDQMLFLKKYLESKVSLSNVNVKTETSSLQTPQVPVYSQPGIKLKKAHTKIIQPPKEEKISSQTNLSQSVPPADPFSDQANIDNKQLAKLPKTKVITRKIKESLFKAAHVFNPEAIPSELIAPIIGDKPITRSNATKLIWEYIKANKLQDKRNINIDEKLAKFIPEKVISMFQLPKYVHQQLHAHAKVIDNGDERLVIEKKLGQINKEIDHVVNNNENATIKETKKDSTVVTIEKTTQEVVDVITNTDESSDGK